MKDSVSESEYDLLSSHKSKIRTQIGILLCVINTAALKTVKENTEDQGLHWSHVVALLPMPFFPRERRPLFQ